MRAVKAVIAMLSVSGLAACQSMAAAGERAAPAPTALYAEGGMASQSASVGAPAAYVPTRAAARLGVAAASSSRQSTPQSFAPMNTQTLVIVGVVVAAVLVLVLLSSGDGDGY